MSLNKLLPRESSLDKYIKALIGILVGIDLAFLIWFSLISSLTLIGYVIILMTFMVVIVWWFLGEVSQNGKENLHLRKVFFIGLSFRFSTMLFFEVTSIFGGAFQTPDAAQYYHQGIKIAQVIRNTTSIQGSYHDIIEIVANPHIGYPAFNGVVYAIFGNHVVLTKLFNVFFGAFLIVIAWKLSRQLFGQKVARRASWLVALHPSLIFWGALNLKESIYALLVAGIIYLAILASTRLNIFAGIGLLGLIGLSFLIRGNLSYFLFLGVLLYYLLFLIKKKRWKVLIVLLALLAGFIFVLAPQIPSANIYLRKTIQLNLVDKVLERAETYWAKHDIARFGVTPQLTPLGLLKAMPLAIGTFFLAPLPWSAEGIGLFKAPGAIIRSLMYPLSFFGMWICIKQKRVEAFLLYYFPTIVIVALLLIAMGGMVRWQMPIIALMAILASIGVGEFKFLRMFYFSYLIALFVGLNLLFFLETGQLVVVECVITAFASGLAGLARWKQYIGKFEIINRDTYTLINYG